MGVYIIFLRHCDHVEGQGCSVQYTGLFGVCSACWNAFIAYCEPRGGSSPPPDPPRWGGDPPPLNPPCVTHPEGVRAVYEKPIGVGGMAVTCWGQSASMITMRLRGQVIRSSSKEPHGEAKMHSIAFITDGVVYIDSSCILFIIHHVH